MTRVLAPAIVVASLATFPYVWWDYARSSHVYRDSGLDPARTPGIAIAIFVLLLFAPSIVNISRSESSQLAIARGLLIAGVAVLTAAVAAAVATSSVNVPLTIAAAIVAMIASEREKWWRGVDL